MGSPLLDEPHGSGPCGGRGLSALSPAMKNHDIVIVGGGIVGSASAYYLKKHGFTGSIAIVEKDTTYQTGCTARSWSIRGCRT